MEIIGTIISVIFIGLILAFAFTVGFTLILWIIGVSVVLTVLVMLREVWRRWWFVRSHPIRDEPPRIIEGEYRDISDKD